MFILHLNIAEGCWIHLSEKQWGLVGQSDNVFTSTTHSYAFFSFAHSWIHFCQNLYHISLSLIERYIGCNYNLYVRLINLKKGKVNKKKIMGNNLIIFGFHKEKCENVLKKMKNLRKMYFLDLVCIWFLFFSFLKRKT